MKNAFGLPAVLAATLVSASLCCQAQDGAANPGQVAGRMFAQPTDSVAKSASASSIAARATVTSSQTVFGGFALTNSATVYILVRGNSLGTLGVTQNYLDVPRVRIYNQAGADMYVDGNG